MGRKAVFEKKQKPGPGRKAKKQPEPVFKEFVPTEDKELSRNQRKRATKRALKAENYAEKEAKHLKLSEEEIPSKPQEKALFMSDDEEDSGSEIFSADESGTEPETDLDDGIGHGFQSDDGSLQGDSDDSAPDGDEFPDDDMSEDSEHDSGQTKGIIPQSGLSLSRPSEQMKNSIRIPTLEEIKQNAEENPDINNIQNRILDTLTVLDNLKIFREDGRSRADYMNILKHDICAYYSYNEWLAEKFLQLLPIKEIEPFFEANERSRPMTVRVNTLKTRRKHLIQLLIAKGVNVEPISWSTVGLTIINSTVPVGATPEYLNGLYMLQGSSSFLPVMTLQPKPEETILDMCAAPGGKTTHIATFMNNTGCIFSNDFKAQRKTALEGNFMRMGVHNAVAITMNGVDFGRLFPRRFDRVLCDAPCSGTGVIAKDPRVKYSKTEEDIKRCSKLQKELILSAIDSCNAKSKTGGYIVYSTCSLMVEENEAVVDYALKRRNVKCIPTPLPSEIGKPGFTNFAGLHFHPDLVNTRRIYPHLQNMDGFFVALLQKTSNDVEDKYKVKPPTEKKTKVLQKLAKAKQKEEIKKKAEAETMAKKKMKLKGPIAKKFNAMKEKKKLLAKKGKGNNSEPNMSKQSEGENKGKVKTILKNSKGKKFEVSKKNKKFISKDGKYNKGEPNKKSEGGAIGKEKFKKSQKDGKQFNKTNKLSPSKTLNNSHEKPATKKEKWLLKKQLLQNKKVVNDNKTNKLSPSKTLNNGQEKPATKKEKWLLKKQLLQNKKVVNDNKTNKLSPNKTVNNGQEKPATKKEKWLLKKQLLQNKKVVNDNKTNKLSPNKTVNNGQEKPATKKEKWLLKIQLLQNKKVVNDKSNEKQKFNSQKPLVNGQGKLGNKKQFKSNQNFKKDVSDKTVEPKLNGQNNAVRSDEKPQLNSVNKSPDTQKIDAKPFASLKQKKVPARREPKNKNQSLKKKNNKTQLNFKRNKKGVFNKK